MGADIWISTVNFVGEYETNEVWEKREKAMLKALEKYKTKLDDLEYDWQDFYDYSNDVMPETYELIKEDVKKVIEDFFSCIIHSRETTIITMPFRQIPTTGGMSWGDSPTKAASLFEQFLTIPPEIVEAGDVETKFLDPIEMILKVYKDIPGSLRKELENYKCAEKI